MNDPRDLSTDDNAGSPYDKLFAVLEAIAATHDCSLAEVAASSGLPFSTVHRVAGQLIARGYIVKLQRGRYRLGPAALSLSSNSSMRSLLEDASRPLLIDLAKACRTHVHLGVFEDDMVTYLANASYGRERFLIEEGMQLEAYCSGIGKILLAHLPAPAREHYLSQGDFVALTPNTIVDRERLSDELDRVRSRGWATDLEEVEPDLRCIAVPLRDQDGQVHAAISASVHSKTGSVEDLVKLLPLLEETSASLSRRLFATSAR